LGAGVLDELVLTSLAFFSPTYYERFRDAFVHEVNHFVDCVLGNKRMCDDGGHAGALLTGYFPLAFSAVLTNPRDALEAAQIAVALTHSFRMAKPVLFGEDGQPILD
jgi:myo-inositol 2-dehydrogenase/D-chiro-inositol 1-dehydrogenase